MITWLTDTLVMTGVLMALVLMLRRPVGRWFGPGAAYALWVLPLLRLVLPPLALPRGVLPRLEVAVGQVTATAAPSVEAGLPAETSVFSDAGAIPSAIPAAADPGFLATIPWGTVLLVLWLAGAGLFLAWRIAAYRAMRRDLLRGARQVARHDGVRIIESPAVSAPLAFGVFDKVVALPVNFLAEADSETSDFAIAHELGHHAGNDLAMLILTQPLFALHWFNPVAWAAWRALRSDQEAACDARVMQGRGREVRARYGRTIASFAAGRTLGLAAPMAGPLSGDKPIIHRLRALARDDVSPLRRVLARSLFAFAIVTVPATATITYAADDEPEIPEPPTPPAVRSVDGATRVSVAPRAPRAPRAPEIVTGVESAGAEWSQLPAPPQPPEPAMPPMPPMPPLPPAPPEPPALDAAALGQHALAIRQHAAQARQAAEARRMSDKAEVMASQARAMAAEAMARAPIVEQTVSDDGKVRRVRIVHRTQDGRKIVEREMVLNSDCPADAPRNITSTQGNRSIQVICTGEPKAAKVAAVHALRSARSAIADNDAISPSVRADILADIDGEIRDAASNQR